MGNRTGEQLGQYRLVRQIGHGGCADVYLGQHVYLQRQAAIKVLSANLTEKQMRSFLAEARLLAGLTHPHIVHIIDFAVEGEVPYLVMDYATQGSLQERHPRGTILSLETIVKYVEQVTKALQYAHDQQIVHRDMKPANMLINVQGDLLLSDFGIAIIEQTTSLTSRPETIGTPAYMAPEQLLGKPQRVSDQYALGSVVYEWLCGHPPFSGPPFSVAMQQIHKDIPPLGTQVSGLAPAVERVVMRALDKSPQKRFSRIQDFALALEKVAQKIPVAAALPNALSSKPESVQKIIHPSFQEVAVEKTPVAIEAMTPSPIPLPQTQTKDFSRHRRKRHWLIESSLILAILLISGGAITLAATSGGGPLTSGRATPTSHSKSEKHISTVIPVPNSQIYGRLLTASPLSQTLTVTATGHKQIAATSATGTLTFHNNSNQVVTIPAGEPITVGNGNGIVAITDVDVVITGPPPHQGNFGTAAVAAHIATPGAAGNIGPTDFGPCCSDAGGALSATTDGFTGGQDAHGYSFVQQSDVDTVVTPAVAQLSQQAKDGIMRQLMPGEELVGQPQCKPKVETNGPVGDTGQNVSSVTVTVSVTCSAEAYHPNK